MFTKVPALDYSVLDFTYKYYSAYSASGILGVL